MFSDVAPRSVTGQHGGSQSLADQAYARLKASIVSCELAPGARVTERTLAEQFGFGLSPIRKALQRLDQEGLVSTRPRSGYRVAPLTIDDVDTLFDAWTVLGSAIIRRAAERCTSQDRDAMASTLRTLRAEQRQAGVSAVDATVETARSIWLTYCRIAGNPRLTDMWARLDADLQRVFVIGGWGDPQGAEQFAALTGNDALHLDDPAVSVERFTGYVDRVHKLVVTALQQSVSLRSHEIVLGDASADAEPAG